MKTTLNVLAVDDHLDYLTPMKLLLQAEGHNAIAVTSGNEALAQVKQWNFDLMIIDVHLEDMNGIELCRQIRELNQRAPIVIHSGCIQEMDRQIGYEAGATMYLSKPEELETILSVANAIRDSEAAKGAKVSE
ncbi:MAG TPA: response regulator [Blastocatellia bacterium]|nr:response regulator [Blastocatellia bacterium]